MEGPSLVLAQAELIPFRKKKILKVSGNSKIGIERLTGQTIKDFKTWGKHLLIQFNDFSLRIHFLMFGSYSVNKQKNRVPRLRLQFKKGEINFYTCSLKFIEEDLDSLYDWKADVMSDEWDSARTIRRLKKNEDTNVSDALLAQEIFAGVGNIIKNEVLFRIKVHPESLVHSLPPKKLRELVKEARDYSFDFLKWKKIYQLRKHWLIYTKKKCPNCGSAVVKKYTGKTKRRSFFCTNCQILYKNPNSG